MHEVLFAQADALSGGAGWAGAGLLGLVLSWLLLKHLPEKDRQIKDLLDSANTRADFIASRHWEENRETQKQFQITLERVIQHCEKEMTGITNTLREKIEQLEEALEQRK